MLRFLTSFYLFTILLSCLRAEDDDKTFHDFVDNQLLDSDDYPEPDHMEIEAALEKFEEKASAAAKEQSNDFLPDEETDTLYDQMAKIAEDMVDLLTVNPNNAYQFLKDKGIERAVVPNLGMDHRDLRTQLLIITKTLFDIAPTTANIATPVFMMDNLLEVFELDQSLQIKAHVLDILSVWLPNNPKAQARLMKVKGLDIFYYQIHKLDPAIIHSLLELFNNILKEHLMVRKKKVQRNKEDLDNLKLYQRIGLIERVSTPAVCKGLLHIFGTAWSYRSHDKEVMIPILELIKNLKPYCTKTFSSRKTVGKASELFQDFLNYIKEVKDKEDNVITANLNVTEVEKVLEDFISILQRPPVKEDL